MPRLLFASALLLCALAASGAEQRFLFEREEMASVFRITLYAESETAANEAAQAAFDRVAELNACLSDYDSESELSRLARTSGSGRAVPVSTLLWRVVERSQLIAQQSDGAFDITLGPLINLWRRTRRRQELPAPALLAEMKARTGYRNMVLDPQARTVKLLVPEMRLDVGGIAKGYAADEALAVLVKHGVTRALVASSGDIVAGDPPPGESGWKVEVASLEAPGAPPPEVLLLAHRGVSTSGDAFQFVEIEGVRYSHVIDPKTGLGMTDHSLVTVVGPDGLTADGLDTTVDVLGPEKGLALIAKTPGTEVRILRTPQGKVEHYESPGWKNLPRPR
jgi:thiamine biosynthesis lipoprotein